MKFTAAVAALAATGAYAVPSNITYTTEVVTALTTYCPYATSLTHNGVTYTITEPTTLTITNCPCTVTKPVTYTTSVVCSTSYANSTSWAPATVAPSTPTVLPTGGLTPTVKPSSVPTAGAGKAAALSGAGLAGVLGLAAFVL